MVSYIWKREIVEHGELVVTKGATSGVGGVLVVGLGASSDM